MIMRPNAGRSLIRLPLDSVLHTFALRRLADRT
jgi:hypothetical protein